VKRLGPTVHVGDPLAKPDLHPDSGMEGVRTSIPDKDEDEKAIVPLLALGKKPGGDPQDRRSPGGPA
jgi:hypothetical protein